MWSDQGKILVVAALDATYERKPFGQILQLVAFAETIQKLSAVCLGCQQEAHFTYKHSNNTGETNDIGGIDKYIPVCRGCFNQYSATQMGVATNKMIPLVITQEGKQNGSPNLSTKGQSPSSPSRSEEEEEPEPEDICSPDNPNPGCRTPKVTAPITQPYEI